MPELATRRAPPAPSPKHALEGAMQLVRGELALVEARLESLLNSPVASIPRVSGHLAFAGGKRFRPLLTLLCAQASGYAQDDRITAAAVGELLHTATLLHDDVIDGGEYRRGRPASRMVFGNGMAVLTGDYCLARALQAMSNEGRIGPVQAMSNMVTMMAEGEVAQLEVAGDWSMTRERYYTVIERKTAALIAWCASVGRLVPLEQVPALEAFGTQLGFAFQIADDVLDMRSDATSSGKSRAQDLREGKATLPVLIACERDPGLRGALNELLADRGPAPETALVSLVERIDACGALDAADEVARQHADAAVDALASLAPSAARDALQSLAHFVARREA